MIAGTSFRLVLVPASIWKKVFGLDHPRLTLALDLLARSALPPVRADFATLLRAAGRDAEALAVEGGG